VNTLPSLTRKSRRILLRDRELKYSPKRLLEVKVTLPDPDRELNSSVSWPQLRLRSLLSAAVVVVEDVVEPAVDVDPMLPVLKAEDKDKATREERSNSTKMNSLLCEQILRFRDITSTKV